MQLSLSALRQWVAFSEDVGMLCHILTSLGMEVEKWTPEDGDIWITIALTPNLAHCNSVQGIAKELSAYWRRPLQRSLPMVLPPVAALALEETHDPVCPLFCGGWVRGVSVGPSSHELRKQVEGFGARSINNVVDLLNVLMFEWGQPLHAYDADQIDATQISVRFAQVGETLVTLDGKERTLDPATLLIADPRPLALAGVMGGKDSEVTEHTCNLFIECAWFDPAVIRRSAKHQELSTEASYRFERGIDPTRVYPVLEQALHRIQDLCGGTIDPERLVSGIRPTEEQEVAFRLTRLHHVLGVAIPHEEVASILTSLDFSHTVCDGVFLIRVPPYRHDIKEEIDVIEEVARFYGYDRLKAAKKPLFRTGALPDSPLYLFEKKVREQLLRLGLQELLTCDLISREEIQWVDCKEQQRIAIKNPRSLDQAYLRPSLLPNHLRVVSHNRDYQQLSLAGFEIGRVYYKNQEDRIEKSVAALTITGSQAPPHWQEGCQEYPVDFFVLKGKIEQLWDALGWPVVSFEPGHHSIFHPHQQAKLCVGEREVGILGQVHPKKNPIAVPIYYAELDLVALQGLSTGTPAVMSSLPAFPGSLRDWTFLLRKDASLHVVWDFLRRTPHPQVDDITLRSIYEHESIGKEWQRVTLRFTYRDTARTLTQTEIDTLHQQMMDQITTKLKGSMS